MGAIFFAKRLARRITAASAPTSCGKYSYATPLFGQAKFDFHRQHDRSMNQLANLS